MVLTADNLFLIGILVGQCIIVKILRILQLFSTRTTKLRANLKYLVILKSILQELAGIKITLYNIEAAQDLKL